MKLSNKFDMPEIYFRLIKRQHDQWRSNSPSDRLALSVTTIIDSPFRYKLGKLYESEVEEDVMDLFFAFRGQMMHKALEDTSLQNVIPEIALGMPVDGVWLSGRIDVVEPFSVADFKMKTVESSWYDRDKKTKDYAEQLNPYKAMLWEIFNLPVTKLTAHEFYMNWVARKAAQESNYPPKPHEAFNIPVWNHTMAMDFIRHRISLFKTPIEQTEICSPENRWAMAAKWALTKKGNKKATKLFDELESMQATHEPIIQYMANKKLKVEDFDVTLRPGIDNRCTGYCRVNTFCPYWKDTYGSATAPLLNDLPIEAVEELVE